MVNAKKKGNAGEHDLAHWLVDNGIKAFRNSMSGGSIWKGDIANNLDLTIEVKTVKRINLLECWQQVNRDASIAHNSPLLAVRFDHMPKKEWLMVLHSEDWLELIKKANEKK
jgi:Holliday junction resolvase